jgi:hypothetical protein
LNCSSKTLFLFHNISFKVYFFCLSISLLYYIFSLSFFSKIYLNISQIKPNCVLFFLSITFPFPFSFPLIRHRIKREVMATKNMHGVSFHPFPNSTLLSIQKKKKFTTLLFLAFCTEICNSFCRRTYFLTFYLTASDISIYLSIYLYILFLFTYFLIYLIFLRSNNITT